MPPIRQELSKLHQANKCTIVSHVIIDHPHIKNHITSEQTNPMTSMFLLEFFNDFGANVTLVMPKHVKMNSTTYK